MNDPVNVSPWCREPGQVWTVALSTIPPHKFLAPKDNLGPVPPRTQGRHLVRRRVLRWRAQIGWWLRAL